MGDLGNLQQVKSGVTVSGDLIGHVRKICEMALQDILSGKVVRHGINGYSHHALPAYIVTVAAVEAFMNEAFLSFVAQQFLFRDASIWNLPRDWLEKVEISKKVILIPQLLFGESLSRDTQPYQDFAMVIKVRNDLVHYKMKGEPPKYLQDLDQRGISLRANTSEIDADYLWPHKLSCSEGIRWAHNTACSTVTEIVSYVNRTNYPLLPIAENFAPITDAYVLSWFQKHGIDPNSNQP